MTTSTIQHLQGKEANATIFADDVESSAYDQIRAFLNSPVATGSRVVIMPDVHAGAGCVIGFTATLTDKIVPNLIGVDIGCGVASWKIPDKGRLRYDRLDRTIRKTIPAGFDLRGFVLPEGEMRDLYDDFDLPFDTFVTEVGRIEEALAVFDAGKKAQKQNRYWAALGTLGGGNHFIEVDRDENGEEWLTIHSGSRNFGLQIAVYHQRIANVHSGRRDGLGYLEGDPAQAYLRDMRIAQAYARLNRRIIAYEILRTLDVRHINDVESVESVHNYIDFTDRVIRKGAISARKGEKVIIPLTMADGVVIGVGLGNEDWNCSAPHGAGRVMSRSKAKAKIDIDIYRKRMREANVWSSCVGPGTLDESPMAYRRPRKILDALPETVVVHKVLKPVYNFKAGA